MRIAGVGKGTDRAEWEVRVPIALIDVEGEGALHEFRVPVVGGAGKGLPALLGLQSMSRQNAVLEVATGAEYLTLLVTRAWWLHHDLVPRNSKIQA